MPISPIRMSVMRGAAVGTVDSFRPVAKEVYTMGSKAKAKLGGRVGSDDKRPALGGRVLTGGESNKKSSSDIGTWKVKDTNQETKPKKPPTDNKYLGPWGRGPAKKGDNKWASKVNNNKQEQDFKPTAAGKKSYGQSGRSAPNVGPTSNRSGYARRDVKLAAAKRLKNGFGANGKDK